MERRRKAIISGGFGGVGLATGKTLAEAGFDVVALYHRTARAAAEALLGTFPPGNHEAVRCDISDPASVTVAFAEVTAKHGGGPDACIHAAVSPILRKNLLETSAEELEQQLKAGFLGGFNILAAGAKAMKKRGGVLVGVLSRTLYADAPHPRMAAYAVAKHALRGLLKELHLELAGGSIHVNAIAPGFMDTPLNHDLPPAVRAFILERVSTGSIKSPDEVARAIAFLCSAEGQGISGKIFSFAENETEDL